ncbi:hypothetical protein CBR_g50748 [Chara braunii]|uniref:EF-hand domain-containing protein n=1 Tax=Chara braunii TaxID=69332 RepID=A0A388K5R3_CHABU|nr:hypothetical protein CBR_g50748 [Chara braunii]|eukprot:GBG65387.1 hypothetical protein CBR_g50748 [Chara braunii]
MPSARESGPHSSSAVKIGWAGKQLFPWTCLDVDDTDLTPFARYSSVFEGYAFNPLLSVGFEETGTEVGGAVSDGEGLTVRSSSTTLRGLTDSVVRQGSPIVQVGFTRRFPCCPHGTLFRGGSKFRGGACGIYRPVADVRTRLDDVNDQLRSPLKQLFDELDKRRSGALDEEEVRRATELLGLPTSPTEVRDFARNAGPVTFDKFACFAAGLEQRLCVSFRKLQKSRAGGGITKEDVLDVLRTYNIPPKTAYQNEWSVRQRQKLGKPGSEEGLGLEDLRNYLVWVSQAGEVLESNTRARAAIDFGGDMDAALPLAFRGPAGRADLRQFPELLTTKDSLAASISGAVARTLVAPLERVKILQMVYPRTARESMPAILRGIRAREGGNRGLWRGNVLNVLRLFPAKAVEALVFKAISGGRFDPNPAAAHAGGYRHVGGQMEMDAPARRVGEGGRGGEGVAVDKQSKSKYDLLRELRRNTAGILASAAGILAAYPIDTLRVAVQSLPNQSVASSAGRIVTENAGRGAAARTGSREVLGIARAIVRNRGVKGLYDGVGAHLLRAVPYILFSSYLLTSLEDRYRRRKAGRSETELGPVGVVLCATAAALCAQTLLYPLETVQRRLQLQSALSSRAGDLYYSGLRDAFKRIIREEGVKSLYAGMGANHVKLLPAAGISFAIHDSVRGLIDGF